MKPPLLDHPLVKNHPRAILAILITFFILIAWIVDSRSEKISVATTAQAEESLDVYIPAGFVLVPIEIQNLASLDSILGPFGVVDLYTEGEDNPVGRGLRLIRSPRDPSQFAVLVAEDHSREIVKRSAKPFQIIVQNRGQATNEVRKPTRSQRLYWED